MSNDATSAVNVDQLECTLEALASQRRLYALLALRCRGAPMSVSALADEVAVREAETTYDRIPSATLTRIYTSLYHLHLPKLADAGVIEYDADAETVALAEDSIHVERIVDAVFEE